MARRILVLLTATLLGMSTIAGAAQAQTAGCSARFDVHAEWATGWVGAVTVTNTGDVPITAWEVVWPGDPAPLLTYSWNMRTTQSGRSFIGEHPPTFPLYPGGSAVFGLQDTGAAPPAQEQTCRPL